MTRIIGILVFTLIWIGLHAQPPTTNLYLFEIDKLSDTLWAVHSPKFLSKNNEQGYNNQPQFIGNHEILFTRQTPTGKNTEIIKLDLLAGSESQVTNTEISEYSPTLMPDSRHFSVVRTELDGHQTLWKYALDDAGTFQNLFPNFEEKIGYHSWINDTSVSYTHLTLPTIYSV